MGKVPPGEVNAIIKFSVNVDGKLYPCDRRISGRTRKKQKIFVAGVGSQDDPESYFAGQRSISPMEQMARRIAEDIIETASGRR